MAFNGLEALYLSADISNGALSTYAFNEAQINSIELYGASSSNAYIADNAFYGLSTFGIAFPDVDDFSSISSKISNAGIAPFVQV